MDPSSVDMDLWTWTCGHRPVDMDQWTWTWEAGNGDMDSCIWTCGRQAIVCRWRLNVDPKGVFQAHGAKFGKTFVSACFAHATGPNRFAPVHGNSAQMVIKFGPIWRLIEISRNMYFLFTHEARLERFWLCIPRWERRLSTHYAFLHFSGACKRFSCCS